MSASRRQLRSQLFGDDSELESFASAMNIAEDQSRRRLRLLCVGTANDPAANDPGSDPISGANPGGRTGHGKRPKVDPSTVRPVLSSAVQYGLSDADLYKKLLAQARKEKLLAQARKDAQEEEEQEEEQEQEQEQEQHEEQQE